MSALEKLREEIELEQDADHRMVLNYHARVLEGVHSCKPPQRAVSTFENHCFEGKSTFGDPLSDSGAVDPEP